MKLLAALALCACSGGKPSAQDELGAWMPKDAAKLWEGAWVMRLADDAPPVAVEIAGDRATVFDGAEARSTSFAVIQPCAVAIGRTELQFVIRDGVVVPGRGAAGHRKGDRAVVCGDGRDPGAPEEGVYIVTKNRCTTWKRDAAGAWSHRRGVCVWASERGEDLLDVGTEHYRSTLFVKGDLLEDRAFTKSAADFTRMDSFAAAKARIDAPKQDRLAAAKAAGGVVGDTTTIAGLHATYAQSPQALVGVDLELAGTVVETSTQSVRGTVASTYVVVADPANPKAMQLVCEVPGELTGVGPGDAVVVRGAIDTRQDHARLVRCAVTKAP